MSPPSVASRRQLLKAVGAGSPVVLTLVSVPVQATQCVMPSGYISATTFASRHPGGTVCTTNGPNFFNANGTATYWPTSSPNTQSLQFSDATLFGSNPEGAASSHLTDTMKQVLGSGYASVFTKYCIAAYLNARIGTANFPLTPTQALDLWKYFKGGTIARPSWVPTAWDIGIALTWLQTQMNA